MKWLLILLIIVGIHESCSKDCDEYTTCETCAAQVGWPKFVNCRWCPKTGTCHAPQSFFNVCKKRNRISKVGECPKQKYLRDHPYHIFDVTFL